MNNAHTTNQLSLLRKLCQRAGRPMPADLTRQQASALITDLKRPWWSRVRPAWRSVAAPSLNITTRSARTCSTC